MSYVVLVDDSVLDELWQPTQMAEEEPGILEAEVRSAIKKLKSRKAPGVDRIDGDLIRYGGETMVNTMFKICNKIWATGNFPTLWTKSLIVTIPKTGDATKCENYRTISLFCHSSKILLEIETQNRKSDVRRARRFQAEPWYNRTNLLT